ncbi:helix-turn-helix domain-containing protein [Halocatena pleomorpha]|uniref:XRE family transcriptional regulator n=1 Tax=Halocatena pleomorpha TaxID=1785090 RepID=A0A3P3RCT6_9EURY|nr:helix-turn-helix transcriptional regulator [Halocatena pleomorpha]RRJ30758.1 XRE family transcriptional regulator [Halocatena pleomorpha]
MQDQFEIKIEEKLSELLAIKDENNAEIANEVGVSSSSITQYRKGETRPSLEKLVALAKALDVSLDYLVLGEDEEADQMDADPVVRYMDQSLQDMQVQTAQHTALVAHVGRRLSHMLDSEIEQYLEENPSRRLYAGIIADTELTSLEKHSQTTRLMLQTLHYNLQDDCPKTPGSFFKSVVNNLSKGREYQYLLAETSTTDWPSKIEQFRRLLIEQTNSEGVVRSNCNFRVTDSPLFTGCGVYDIAADDLENEDPILYDFLTEQDYVHEDGRVGYVISPSLDVQGVTIMDNDHLTNAMQSFETLWEEADPI